MKQEYTKYYRVLDAEDNTRVYRVLVYEDWRDGHQYQYSITGCGPFEIEEEQENGNFLFYLISDNLVEITKEEYIMLSLDNYKKSLEDC